LPRASWRCPSCRTDMFDEPHDPEKWAPVFGKDHAQERKHLMATRYTKDHEWIRLDGDVATVGITEHAQNALGDIVYVELPEIGKKLEQGGEAAVVESVKAASDVYAPAGGEVVAVNDSLDGAPATINEDAEGKGWFFRLKLSAPDQLDALMSDQQYKQFLKTLE
jgi:glycine cleavage system H protein